MNLRKIDLQKYIANMEDEWIQILSKNIRLLNGKGWSIRGIKSCKQKNFKKLTG
tara:strand:+ start:252 stop:413 length:162 start_codon:yes stop_codon:yes gene_type:complete